MYDYNVQPITACPDDPARTATPDFREVTRAEIKELADDYEVAADSVVKGNRPYADVCGERLSKEKIAEEVFNQNDLEILAELLGSPLAEKIMKDWAYRKAERRLT